MDCSVHDRSATFVSIEVCVLVQTSSDREAHYWCSSSLRQNEWGVPCRLQGHLKRPTDKKLKGKEELMRKARKKPTPYYGSSANACSRKGGLRNGNKRRCTCFRYSTSTRTLAVELDKGLRFCSNIWILCPSGATKQISSTLLATHDALKY